MAGLTARIDRGGVISDHVSGISRPIRDPRVCRAFTLAESLIASVVLAAGVIGISSTLGVSYKQSRVLQTTSSAAALAEQLMEEISAKPWSDPDTGLATDADRESARAQYDNVFDYNGFADLSSGLTTLGGDSVATVGGELYSRSVTVEVMNGPAGSANADGAFARVTVTVTAPGGDRVQLGKTVCRTNVVK